MAADPKIGDIRQCAMQYFTADEAAEFLRLSTSTLAKLRMTLEGPRFAKLGGRVIYDRADLMAWVESCKQTTESHGVNAPQPCNPTASDLT